METTQNYRHRFHLDFAVNQAMITAETRIPTLVAKKIGEAHQVIAKLEALGVTFLGTNGTYKGDELETFNLKLQLKDGSIYETRRRIWHEGLCDMWYLNERLEEVLDLPIGDPDGAWGLCSDLERTFQKIAELCGCDVVTGFPS
jgi:hypothetical protein